MRRLVFEVELFGDDVQDLKPLGDHFLPDAVAGHHCDFHDYSAGAMGEALSPSFMRGQIIGICAATYQPATAATAAEANCFAPIRRRYPTALSFPKIPSMAQSIEQRVQKLREEQPPQLSVLRQSPAGNHRPRI